MKRKITDIILELKGHPELTHLVVVTKGDYLELFNENFKDSFEVNDFSQDDIDKCIEKTYYKYKQMIIDLIDNSLSNISLYEKIEEIISEWVHINKLLKINLN